MRAVSVRTKLAAKAGVKVPPNYVYPHPDMCSIKHEDHAQCLKLIQKAMENPAQKPQVEKLYITMGVYLGYALAQYCEYLGSARALQPRQV